MGRETGPVVILGCGRLGSAIVEGWLLTGAVDPADLIILTPSSKPAAEAARAAGARINPPLEALAEAHALVVAVKPAMWRSACAPIVEALAPDATIVSVMAGVRAADLSAAFHARPVARIMPTTAVAKGQGVAAILADDRAARALAHGLFAPLADVVDLDDENLMDVATAVAGSGPAYLHAFTQALAKTAEANGLAPDAALSLARGAARSAAASAQGSDTLEALIAQVASPGGTTQAGLAALNADGRLDAAVAAAVNAALTRARDLSA